MDRESFVFKARMAEKAERFTDMLEIVRKAVRNEEELSPEERNLLSVAYKNTLTAKRLSWRTLAMMEQAEEGEVGRHTAESIQQYRREIEKEIEVLCYDVLDLIDNHLLPKAKSNETKIYFQKMRGDYNRYLSEIMVGDKKQFVAESAAAAYKEASELAVTELAPTDPIRLGLALNFSVFFYEILNSTDRACRLAKAAFEDAIAELDTLSDDTYKDATLIMQLLRDNLTIWSDGEHTLQGQEGEI